MKAGLGRRLSVGGERGRRAGDEGEPTRPATSEERAGQSARRRTGRSCGLGPSIRRLPSRKAAARRGRGRGLSPSSSRKDSNPIVEQFGVSCHGLRPSASRWGRARPRLSPRARRLRLRRASPKSAARACRASRLPTRAPAASRRRLSACSAARPQRRAAQADHRGLRLLHRRRRVRRARLEHQRLRGPVPLAAARLHIQSAGAARAVRRARDRVRVRHLLDDARQRAQPPPARARRCGTTSSTRTGRSGARRVRPRAHQGGGLRVHAARADVRRRARRAPRRARRRSGGGAKFDLIFIDVGHGYDIVRGDIEAGLVAAARRDEPRRVRRRAAQGRAARGRATSRRACARCACAAARSSPTTRRCTCAKRDKRDIDDPWTMFAFRAAAQAPDAAAVAGARGRADARAG